MEAVIKYTASTGAIAGAISDTLLGNDHCFLLTAKDLWVNSDNALQMLACKSSRTAFQSPEPHVLWNPTAPYSEILMPVFIYVRDFMLLLFLDHSWVTKLHIHICTYISPSVSYLHRNKNPQIRSKAC